MAVIELGHDASELPLVAVLAEALARASAPFYKGARAAPSTWAWG